MFKRFIKYFCLAAYFVQYIQSQDTQMTSCSTQSDDDTQCMIDSIARKCAHDNNALENIQNLVHDVLDRLPEKDVNNFNQDMSKLPRNCLDVQRLGNSENGVYRIYPFMMEGFVDVYCDMNTDGGGWTVFQRRNDGSVNFTQDWNSYRDGFGDLEGEHWLGNRFIHILTNENAHELRVDLGDWNDNRAHAKYRVFHIDSETEKFRLHVDTYSGTAGDSLQNTGSAQNGMAFSSIDQDNNLHSSASCSIAYSSGFWFKDCFSGNPNGVYSLNSAIAKWKGIIWYTWKGDSYGLKFTEMKMRPIQN